MTSPSRLLPLPLLLLFATTTAGARQPDTGAEIREELLRSYSRAANRLVRLAEAMPPERFAWRPAEGVRSFSEVLMHVAEGNYHFAKSLGVAGAEAPEPGTLEKITSRDEAIARLRESNDLARRAIAGTDQANLGGEVEFFGMKQSKRALVLLVAEHAHEHVGQAIAYARMNGIAPPWSQ